MTTLSFAADDAFGAPVMVLAMSGWVDAASAGTGAAEHIAEDGDVVARFDPDALFDYRSSRPWLHFTDGRLERIAWPRLEVVHRVIGGKDLLVCLGNEPDFRWRSFTDDLVSLAKRFGVTRLVTLGAVPAPVPHTRPVRILCTASDPDLLLDEDTVLRENLVVPGAAVSVVRQGMVDAGIPAVGYWAQVPHYLQSRFHAGVLSLVERTAAQVGIVFPVGDLAEEAATQIVDITRDLAGGDEDGALGYVERLEQLYDESESSEGGLGPVPGFTPTSIPTMEEIESEIEAFLRSATDEH